LFSHYDKTYYKNFDNEELKSSLFSFYKPPVALDAKIYKFEQSAHHLSAISGSIKITCGACFARSSFVFVTSALFYTIKVLHARII